MELGGTSSVSLLPSYNLTLNIGAGIFGNTQLGQTAAAKPAFNFLGAGTATATAPAGTGLFGTTQPGLSLLIVD